MEFNSAFKGLSREGYMRSM